ncbi:MAG: HPr family phosphocarrier protein [Bdellovibrionota bacterium]
MEKTVRILNEEGLHARPAGLFVKKASEFVSTVEVRANGMAKNGKSIMALMSLGLAKDAEITITAKGADASAAVEALVDLVAKKFQL